MDVSMITHSVGQAVGKLIFSYIADRNAGWYNHFWMGIWQYLIKIHLDRKSVV